MAHGSDSGRGRDPCDDTGEVPALPAIDLDSHDDLQDSGEGLIDDEDDDEVAHVATNELVAELGLDDRTRSDVPAVDAPPKPGTASTKLDTLAARVDAAQREVEAAAAAADDDAPAEDRVSTVRVAAGEPRGETERLTPVAPTSETARVPVVTITPEERRRSAPTVREAAAPDALSADVAATGATQTPKAAAAAAIADRAGPTATRDEGRAPPRREPLPAPPRVKLLMAGAALLPLLLASVLAAAGVPQAAWQRMSGRDPYEPNEVLDAARPLALGLTSALTLTPGDVDWFALDAPAGRALVIEVTPAPSGRGATSLHTPDGVCVASSREGGAVERVVWTVPGKVGDAAVPIRLRVWGARGDYEVTARSTDTAARYEPNDTEAEAAPLEPGVIRGVQCNGTDHYRVRVPAGHPMLARILEGPPGLSLAWAGIAAVGSGAVREVRGKVVAVDRVGVLQVSGASGPYDLELALETPEAVLTTISEARVPTLVVSDAELEPNDRRDQARAITPGRYPKLEVDREDWYSLELPPGAGAEVVLRFENDRGDIELELYRGDQARALRSSTSAADEESARVGAVEVAGGPLLIRVFGGRANDYAMTVVVGGEGTSGTRIEPGEYPALVCTGTDLWTFHASAGQVVEVAVRQTRRRWSLGLELLDAGSWNPVSASQSTSFEGEDVITRVVYQPTAEEDLTFRVSGGGSDYSMNLALKTPTPGAPLPLPPRMAGGWSQQVGPPRLIGAGVHPDQLVIDETVYLLDVQAGQKLSVAIAFRQAQGDIDLDLQDDGGNTVLVANSGQDGEELEYLAPRTQQLTLRAYGYGVPNRFTLTVAYDGSSAPVDIEPGAYAAMQCNGNALHGIAVPGGKRLVATITFDAAAGDLDLQLLDAGSNPLATSEGVDAASERVEYVAPADERVTLRVYNATNEYHLDLRVEEP